MELQQAHGNVLLSVARSQGDQPHDQEQKTISALVLAITGGNRRASGGRDQPDPALLIAKRAAGLIQVPSRPRVCRKRERLPSSGCIESDPARTVILPSGTICRVASDTALTHTIPLLLGPPMYAVGENVVGENLLCEAT